MNRIVNILNEINDLLSFGFNRCLKNESEACRVDGRDRRVAKKGHFAR